MSTLRFPLFDKPLVPFFPCMEFPECDIKHFNCIFVGDYFFLNKRFEYTKSLLFYLQ